MNMYSRKCQCLVVFLLVLALGLVCLLFENGFVFTMPSKPKRSRIRTWSDPTDTINRNDPVTKPECQPVDRILYLKTHKTGSSTMTNILNRYGDFKDLIFALPSNPKSYSFSWPNRFRVSSVGMVGRAPNILCNHARFNKAPMNWHFPKESSRYVTIIREPTQQFESVFNFFYLKNRIGLRNDSSPLAKFVENPAYYIERLKVKSLTLLKNPMLFDLGLDTETHSDLNVVRRYIDFLHKEFDLVILMEYFDESLVLLKREFCWKTEDILYFKLNERKEKQKQLNLTKATKERIRKWNEGDVLLYEFFNQTLWRRIQEQGPDFYNDLEVFRKVKEAIKNTCLREGSFLTNAYGGRLVQGYAVRKDISEGMSEFCQKMIMNELSYVDYLRDKMVRKLAAIDNLSNDKLISLHKVVNVGMVKENKTKSGGVGT